MSKNIIIVLLLIIGFTFDSYGQTPTTPPTPDTSQVESKAAQEMAAVSAKLQELQSKLSSLETTSQSTAVKVNCESIKSLCAPSIACTPPNVTACQSQATICSNAETLITTNSGSIGTALRNAIAIFEKISTPDKYQLKCTQSHAKGDLLCALTTSPYAQVGTALMNQLTSQLGQNTSAKTTCDSTNNFASMAQTALSAGGVACGLQKQACISSCGDTVTELQLLQSELRKIESYARTIETNAAQAITSAQAAGAACITAQGAAQTAAQAASNIQRASNQIILIADSTDESIVAPLYATDAGYHEKCQNAFSTGLSQIMGTASNLIQRAAEAKACSEQLAGNSTASVEQMCAIAANANSTMCKCRNNNNAEGCPGAIAKMAGGNLKALNTGGASNMAGLSYGSKIGGAGGDFDLGDLGDDAKKELEKHNQEASASMFGAAGGASAGGAGGTGPATPAAGGEAGAEEGSSIGSRFANAVGSAMRSMGFGGGGGARPGGKSKIEPDQYKKIQRKLAAEQFGKEVSNASGLTNFEKINRRYTTNIPTFLAGE